MCEKVVGRGVVAGVSRGFGDEVDYNVGDKVGEVFEVKVRGKFVSNLFQRWSQCEGCDIAF